MEFQDEESTKYKVTRRLAEMSVPETKIFLTEEEAKAQFEEWLK